MDPVQLLRASPKHLKKIFVGINQVHDLLRHQSFAGEPEIWEKLKTAEANLVKNQNDQIRHKNIISNLCIMHD